MPSNVWYKISVKSIRQDLYCCTQNNRVIKIIIKTKKIAEFGWVEQIDIFVIVLSMIAVVSDKCCV